MRRIVDRRRRNVFGEKHLHRVGECAFAYPGGDKGVDLVGPGLAWDRVDVLGPVREIGAVDGAVETGGDAGRRTRNRDPLVVRRPIRVAGRARISAVARAALDLAELVVGQRGLFDEAGQRFDEADVDQLTTATVDVAVIQRRQHGVGGRLRCDAVGEHEGRQGRRTVGLPADMGESAHRLGEGAEAGAVAGGTAEAVTRHVEDHQVRVPFVQRLVVQPPAGQSAGPGVDDEDVALCQQPVQ